MEDVTPEDQSLIGNLAGDPSVIKESSSAEFAEDVMVASRDTPVIVDFWAEWCGPCKQISPILSELAEDYKEKILIAKVNIDENPEVPSNYGIMSIPTLILFKDGKSVSSQIGVAEKSSLTQWIDDNI